MRSRNVPKTSSTVKPLLIVALAKWILRQRNEMPLILNIHLLNLSMDPLIFDASFSTPSNLLFFPPLVLRSACLSNPLRGLTATFLVRYDQLDTSEIVTAMGIR